MIPPHLGHRLTARLKTWFPSFWDWGTSTEERLAVFPCDRYPGPFDEVYYRGVTIQAPAPVIFRWLTQLRLAPYSYDWLDNGGRSSPHYLIPDPEPLAVGQKVMFIFHLLEFELDRHLTLGLREQPALAERHGGGVLTYALEPRGLESCRLLVKILIRHPPGILGLASRLLLPGGDWLMMRRQLLNLRRLAESMAPAG